MPISTISLDVDQPTFQNWSLALANLTQTFTVATIVVNPLPGIQIPPTLSFSGVELLNEVGRATTRPDVIDDPDRLFALFRYGTKVSSQTPNFRLSSERRLRDIHKNSVLSDEIGAGFALLFGTQVLGASVFLDLADAVRRGSVATSAPRSTVPDYIGLYGPANSIVVLEAKGSQTRGRCSSRQIPKGCQQVSSVSLPPGRTAVRVVVGTELNKDDSFYDTTVFIGDPPEGRSYRYFRDETPESIAVREHYVRIAALIGDVELFRRIERPEAAERITARLVEREVGKWKALGSTFEVRSPIGTAGFFVGMDLPTRENLLASLTDVRGPSVPFVKPEAARHRDNRGFSSYSVSRDGTVLELWFEGEIVNQVDLQ